MPRSIAEIRKANGGLDNLTDEDILQSTFQQYKNYYPSLDAYAAEVGYGGAGRSLAGSRISAGVDQYQAGLLGLGGAIARGIGADGVASAFDRRRQANEAAAAYAQQQAADLGGISDFRDVTGVGSALNYAGGLAAQSLPYLGEAAAGALTGGIALGGTAARMGLSRAVASQAGAVAAGYPSAVGDVLSAQREAGGERLGVAALGGIPYAALNAIGIEGQLARGLRPVVDLGGSLTRRIAAGAGMGAVGESIGETGQEIVNQVAGRMAVDPNETIFNEAANRRYVDAAVGGATLGGLFGAAGGVRGPRRPGLPEESDLTQPLDTTTRPDPSQFVTQDQTVGLKKFIDETTGVVRPSRKGYEKQFEAAFNEPSGQFVSDAATGVERELTVGELMQRGSASMDLTQDNPADATAAAEAATKVATTRDPRDVFLRDELKVVPNNNSRQLFNMMEEQGIDPKSPAMVPVWNYAASKYMNPSRLTKATELMDAAIIKSRQEAPSVSTPVSTVQQPAGSVGVVSPVVQGSVGDAGRPAPVAGTMVRSPAVARAPLQQAGVLPVATSQPSTPVTTGESSGTQAPQTIQAAPQGQATTTVPSAAPAVKPSTKLRLPKQEKLASETDVANIADIARMTGNTVGIDAALEDEAGLRGEQRDFTADDLEAVIEQHLSKSKDKERDRQILNAYITARRLVPEGYKGNIAKEIAASFGIAESRVRQIGNPELLANTASSMGFDRGQVFDSLGVQSAKKAAATELGKLEGELSRLEAKAKPAQADIDRMSELSEQIDRTKGNIESGDLNAALKGMGFEGEAGEAFSTMDDAREWQKSSTAGSQTAVDLVVAADFVDALRVAAAELRKLNLPKAAEAAEAQIAIRKARYEALLAEVAPKAAPVSKATATVKEAQQRWKDAGRDITKLSSEDLGLLLPYVRDTIKNTELAGKITAELANRGETNAVQVESPASVPVQPKAETGQGVVAKVRRAQKPAAESKAQVPAVILTQAEQAAQAWDVVAADYPQAPKFADLTKAQQNNFIGFGEENWTKADVETELTKMARAAAPTQRVEYPPTAGQQNAPAYLVPSQRAVVDFMNGDITREELQQKFADLKMTEGQQRSVTNRIEWFPADFEAVKSLTGSGPKLRALRTVTTTDADNASVELQEQELARLEKVPGVGNALSRFRKEGLGNLVDYVGGWYVTDSNVDWDGGFTAIDGQAAVLLRRGALTDSERVEWTVYHEVGHAADQTHLEDGGVFSSQPEFNVRLEKGKIKPVGSVMKEAFDFYTNNPTSDLAKHLSYPFNRAQHSDLDGDGIREELFAQLWATYTTRDGREFLEDNLPTVADFMEQAYEQVKQTDYVAAAANEAQNTAKAGGQASQGNGQSRQVPLRQTAVRFRAIRPQGLIDRNIAKLPQQSQQPVRRVTEAIGDLGGKYLDYAVFTNDLVNRAQALGLGAAKTFSDRLAARNAKVSEEERKIEKIADRYALIEDDNKGDGPGSVNEFLFESTRTGKWGYNTGNFKADPAMKAMFDKLGPKAQQFVKDVFAHGDATLSNKKKIVLEATNSEYDAMIKAAQVAVNNAAGPKARKDALDDLANVKAEKAATLKRFQTLFRIREGIPYAPIKRTGTYVVIGKSDAYKAAETKGDNATLKKLESDPDHYHVTFVDTKWQARNLKDNLIEQGVFTDTQFAKRAEAFDEMFSGEAALPAITKLRNTVDARATTPSGAKDPTAGKLLNIINQLYLEALAEGSARKSEMRRRGVAGEVDMLQSFTQQGRADANFLASVEFEPKIQDALQQMRNQSRTGDRERKSEIFDELTQRYADSLDSKPSPFINGLTNMASKFFLASSPGYYLQNLTQPFMMSLPAMAGRHDYTKAAKELFTAYAELGPMFKDVKLFDQQFDFSKAGKTTGEKAAINDLVNQGKIDIGLATEINEYKVGADGNLSKFAQRLNKGMRMAVQKVEATNRLSTAIAAYRLEFARTNDAAKATQYAADILTETHGDYTAFNAPRAFNTQWGKVALQFRKFQLIQIAFYAKLIRDAFTNPAERAAALKTLGYSLGHTAVFAGMMGLPGYAAIAAILGAFGDDDEKYDLTAEMRKALGPEWADMIMRGAPTLAGMDLSGKIGAGNMLSIMPFSDADLSTNAGRAEAFGTLMGGAALGMTSRVIDGLGLIASGDYYKGIERTMPKGVSDALKAGRQGAEGMTRRNGDVVLPDSEVSVLDTVWTAMGLPAVKQAVTYERQNRMRDVTENFNDRTTRVKNDYAKAVREQDTQAMAEARAAWTKLQQTRQRNGLQPQPVSALLKAPQEQKAREKRTVEGVAYREGQRKLAESIAAN